VSKRGLLKLALVLAIALTVAGVAFAWFSSTGSGTASGSVGGFDAAVITAPASSNDGTVGLTWSDSHVTPDGSAFDSEITYTVERSANSGSTWTTAGGTCATPSGTACSDSTADGDFVYRVIAHFRSWTATSANSSSVHVDQTAPTVSVAAKSGQADPTNAQPVLFTVSASESVSDLSASDVSVVAPGGTSGPVTKSVVRVDGSHFTVSVGGLNTDGSADGDVSVSVNANAVHDDAGNDNTAGSNTATVVWDRTAPTVTVARAAGQAATTNSQPINYTIALSEAPTSDLQASSVTVSVPANNGGVTKSLIKVDPTHYTLAVSGLDPFGAGDGDVSVSVDAGAVSDAAGNANVASNTATVVWDRTAPTVVSSVLAGSSPTNAGSVSWTVTFSESVTGVDATDFTLTTTGVTGTPDVTNVTGSGASYTVTASTGGGSGTVRLNVVNDGSIHDGAGNALSGGTFTTGETYTIDRAAPAPTITSPANNSLTLSTTPTISGTAGTATGDASTVTVKIYNGSGTGGTVAQTFNNVAVTGGNWSVNAATLAAGTYTAQVTQTDAATNSGAATAVFTVTTVLLSAPADGSYATVLRPIISGTTSAATAVTIRIYNGTGTGGTLAQPSFNATPAAGSWSATTPTNLIEGNTYTVQAQQGASGPLSSANTFIVDKTGPAVGAQTIVKTEGLPNGADGFVRQGGTYYIYADVTDATSGVNTVTASIGNVSTATSATLSPCTTNCTIAGTDYNYVSAQQTAKNTLTEGNKAYTITATDQATNVTAVNKNVVGDNTRPKISSIATVNGGAPAIDGRPGETDTITFGYDSSIDATSFVSTFPFLLSPAEPVEVKITQGGGAFTNDTIQILSANGATVLPFGTIDLGAAGAYVTGGAGTTLVFGGTGAANDSTIVVTAGGDKAYKVTLGSLNAGLSTGTPATTSGNTTATWAPGASNPAFDYAGNLLDLTTTPSVSNTAQKQF
jgi:hypothetical protein